MSDKPETILRMQLTLPPVSGGMEQHVRRLTDEQRKLGYRVHLLFAEGDSVNADDLLIGQGYGIARIRPQSLRSLCFLIACVPVLWRRRGRVDLVHVHGDWSMVLVGQFAKWMLRAKVLVLSIHGGSLPSRMREWLRNRIFPLADLIHTTGRRDAQRIEKQLMRRVLWQSSGIENIFLEPQSRVASPPLPQSHDLLIISTAVLRPKKNIDLVLDVAARMPEASFLIIGDGPELARLEERVVREDLGNVRFLGKKSQPEVRAWLDRAHLFLCTSLVDGTPTSVLEGMARGLPIVTSNCAEFSGIVDHGETGYVIKGFGPEDYVAALRMAASPCEEWRRMSRECSRRAEASAWPRVAATITQAMLECLRANDVRNTHGKRS